MIRELFAVALVWGLHAYAQAGPASTPDPWKPLQFLAGTWEARTVSGSAGAITAGTYSFQFELRNHIMARHTKGIACKGPADFDCEHGDLLYIYPEGHEPALKAIYFDNEGHVIHYDVSATAANTVIFLSDSSRPGPQFRLSYELKGSTMFGKFQILPPGQTEFRSYLEWSGDRK